MGLLAKLLSPAGELKRGVLALSTSSTGGQFDEQAVPLTSAHATDDDDYAPPPPRVAPSKGSRHSLVKKAAVVVVAVVALHAAYRWAVLDPTIYPLNWHDSLLGYPITENSIELHSGQRIYIGSRDTRTGIDSWKGIRYSIPAERFRAGDVVPEAMGHGPAGKFAKGEWVRAERFNSTVFNPGCPRPKGGNMELGGGFEGIEDCLALNIWAPRYRREGETLPVMVWIHGGGFYTGWTGEDQYNPETMLLHSMAMHKPFIFVSINYRLGVLGFSAAPPRPADDPVPPHVPMWAPDELDLNVGLKDQVIALEWIKRYIGDWGGDPTRVTAVGHSAGAVSVGLHLLYTSEDLMSGAVMLSGGPTSFPIPWPHDAAQRTVHSLPSPLHCPSPEHNTSAGARPWTPPSTIKLVECMQEKPLHDLLEASRGMYERAPKNGYFPWYPVLEGEWEGAWLDVRPSMKVQRGSYNKIPVLMGTVMDEATRFIDPDVEGGGQHGIEEVLRGIFSFTYGAIEGLLEPLWELYPDDAKVGSPYHTGSATFGLDSSYKRAASMVGDLLFQAPKRFLLRDTAKDFGDVPSWSFIFNEPRPNGGERFGVAHGADLRSWFGNPIVTEDGRNEKDVKLLSKMMITYLINFVNHQDPNGPGLRHWPQYGPERLQLFFALKTANVVKDDDRVEAMEFINRNAPIFAR